MMTRKQGHLSGEGGMGNEGWARAPDGCLTSSHETGVQDHRGNEKARSL